MTDDEYNTAYEEGRQEGYDEGCSDNNEVEELRIRLLFELKNLKKQIRELPNRDDKLYPEQTFRVGVLDGGGVGRFQILGKIEIIEKKIEKL